MKEKLPAVGLIAALLVFWQIAAGRMNQEYILPTPLRILETTWELRGPLFTVHLPATLWVTLAGFAISMVSGVLLAILMDASQVVRRAMYPLVVVSQTIPTTAIAPLFIVWFGYGYTSKIIVNVLMTFFAVTVTVYDGFLGTKREQVELMESMGANRREIFWKLKFPSALPQLFSAIKMAIPISIIGAAIAEWLGAQKGLGFFSRRMMTQLNGPGVFAPILVMSVMAVISVAVVKRLERHFVKGRGEI